MSGAMKRVSYKRVATYKEAEKLLLAHDNARLVAWEYDMNKRGFVVAVEEG